MHVHFDKNISTCITFDDGLSGGTDEASDGISSDAEDFGPSATMDTQKSHPPRRRRRLLRGQPRKIRSSIRGLVSGMTSMFLSKKVQVDDLSSDRIDHCNDEVSENNGDLYQFGIAPAAWSNSQSNFLNTDAWKTPSPTINLDFQSPTTTSIRSVTRRASINKIEGRSHRRPNRPNVTRNEAMRICDTIFEEEEGIRKRKIIFDEASTRNVRTQVMSKEDAADFMVSRAPCCRGTREPFSIVSHENWLDAAQGKNVSNGRQERVDDVVSDNHYQVARRTKHNAGIGSFGSPPPTPSKFMLYYFDPKIFDDRLAGSGIHATNRLEI